METIVRRTFARVDIHKSLSYNGFDTNRNVIERYLGVALNVSQSGLQLETDCMIHTKYILLMFFDYNSNYVAAQGEVVYSNKDESGKYKTGINLYGTRDENLQFIKTLIKSYHYQKNVPIFIS
jgi:hypothetical protein